MVLTHYLDSRTVGKVMPEVLKRLMLDSNDVQCTACVYHALRMFCNLLTEMLIL